MSTPIAVASDLGTYLTGDPNGVDASRATLMLQLAQDKCETIWSTLNATALGIVLAVAARAYGNVASATAVGIGSGHIGYGTTGNGQGVGGLYLSRAERRDLRLLAGRGGAFSVDPTPADAGQGLQPWDQNVTWLTGVPLVEDQNH